MGRGERQEPRFESNEERQKEREERESRKREKKEREERETKMKGSSQLSSKRF